MVEELKLIPLCEVTIQVGDPQLVGPTPTGNMMIGEIQSANWEGERFRARLRGSAAADWLTFAPDGTGYPDVRMTLETHDGALVYVSYTGRFVAETSTAYTTPSFRTGDERYAWLNSVQCVAKGSFDAESGRVHYPMVFEIR